MFAVDSPPRVTVDSGYTDDRQPLHAFTQAKVISSINFSSRSGYGGFLGATTITSHEVADVTVTCEDAVSHCLSEYFGTCRSGVRPGAVTGVLAQFRKGYSLPVSRRGDYPAPVAWPADIPGLEIAGEVLEAGASVAGVAPGDRVMALIGSHAERLVIPADLLIGVPAGLSWEQAGGFPEIFSTGLGRVGDSSASRSG
jgi:hypothetical protein